MKIITSLSLALFLFVQVAPAIAATTSPSDDLRLQLSAIVDYLNNELGVAEPLTNQEMREIIDDSSDWIVNAQEDNGHFGYEYAPFEDKYSSDDGMVRQAGTLFALSEVYKHQSVKDKEVAETIEKAIEYFESVSAKIDSKDGDFWCIRNSERSSICDLGSASLALIGILNYVSVHPEKIADYNENIEKYRGYIMTAKFQDEGFSKRYRTDDGFSAEESPFYNGEAMLALVKYYQHEPSEDDKKLLHELFVYLSNADEYESPLYLWITAALKDMQRLWPNEAYQAYASDFTKLRVVAARARHDATWNYCAPLEGLTSAYSILENYETPEYLDSLDNEIEFWLSRTKFLQLHEDKPYRLVIEDGQPKLLTVPNMSVAHGGFLTASDNLTQRIDFTQHCASAYLQKLVDIDGKGL